MSSNSCQVAGIDEVGKGSLFGPVFAGAVSLDSVGETYLLKAGLKDSKKLTQPKRAVLVPLIKKYSQMWSIGQASAKEIDRLGIRLATEKAMLRALQKLNIEPNLVLIDGVLPLRTWEGLQKTIIHGEDHSPAIAAASVIAKEARDSLIKRLSIRFPNYGLKKNVGYPTKLHREVLRIEGPSSLHRRSFLSKIITNPKCY